MHWQHPPHCLRRGTSEGPSSTHNKHPDTQYKPPLRQRSHTTVLTLSVSSCAPRHPFKLSTHRCLPSTLHTPATHISHKCLYISRQGLRDTPRSVRLSTHPCLPSTLHAPATHIFHKCRPLRQPANHSSLFLTAHRATPPLTHLWVTAQLLPDWADAGAPPLPLSILTTHVAPSAFPPLQKPNDSPVPIGRSDAGPGAAPWLVGPGTSPASV